MGKLYLTMEELVRQFPTIESLLQWEEGKNPNDWGLCQDITGKVIFGKDSEKLTLQMSLNQIYEYAHSEHEGGYDPSDILLFYGVDYTGDDIVLDFIELSSYVRTNQHISLLFGCQYDDEILQKRH